MIKAVILDLDGTVYLGSKAVDGASDFVKFLKANNLRVLFVTNRANRLPLKVADQLNEMGITCTEHDILTSSQATAQFLSPAPAYIIGEAGLEQALLEKGFTITDHSVKYVIVSYDRGFNYDKLKTACSLVYAGAEFIATNPDKGLKTAEGIYPGTGSIVAAVEAACGIPPVVIGKPQPLILNMAAEKLNIDPSEIMAVGDNIDTDIPSASRSGMIATLILTGISKRSDAAKSEIKPHHIVADYTGLTNLISSMTGRG